MSDSALFHAALGELPRLLFMPLRVDVRPLAPNPALVTMRGLDLMPGRLDPTAAASPFDTTDANALAARRAVVRSLRLLEIDFGKDAGCPGAMAIPTPEVVARRRENCPKGPQYSSVLIALPRRGGPYWPENVDERAEFSGRDVYSVRVLGRGVDSTGSTESSMDMVFERTVRGELRFIRARALLIIE